MIPDLDRFTIADAWRLGSGLVERATRDGLPVTICIHLGEHRVFHAALPGTSADNDHWVERKTRIVRHFAQASRDVAARYAGDDPFAFLAAFALPSEHYFPAGGAVPIVVRGTMVGVLAVSGLDSDADHDLAVEALIALSGS